MLKRLSVILLLLISISAFIVGGKYIFDKQSNQISLLNFTLGSDANLIYIPSLDKFNANQIDLLSLNLEGNLMQSSQLILDILKKENITQEGIISYSNHDFIAAFKQGNLEPTTFLTFLNNQLNVKLVEPENIISVNGKVYYYFINDNYFAISNLQINLKHKLKFNKYSGNYLYSLKHSKESEVKYFTKNNGKTFIYSIKNGQEITGAPTSPDNLFNIIPSSFDTLYFYGSSRFEKDINQLTNVNKSQSFFSWVENSIIHLKKDSFEIIIGKQNEFQTMSNILDEQTLSLSNDSLLPTPLYKNDYSLHFFKSNYNWKDIIPYTKKKFNIYCEINNLNVLANSPQAIYWLIRELQLGNTFSTIQKEYPIPKKAHKLSIYQNDSSQISISKNWISKNTYFQSKAESKSNTNKEDNTIRLVSSFVVNNSKFNIKTYSVRDSLNIVLCFDDKITSYTENGKINWIKNLAQPLLVEPVFIKKDSNIKIVIITSKRVDVINENNQSITGFPIDFDENILFTEVIEKSSRFNIIINTDHQILNIDHNGNPKKDWNTIDLAARIKKGIKSNIINNKSIISFKDINDSLFIFDENGREISSPSYSNLNHSSNFISGADFKIYGFSSPYLIHQTLDNTTIDSLKLNQDINPVTINWFLKNNKIFLVIEEFNRIIIFNEFGLLEQEIQKPENNLTLLTNQFEENSVVIFANLKNNELYLLDSFGKKITNKPIFGKNNFTLINNKLIVYHNSQIKIYKIK